MFHVLDAGCVRYERELEVEKEVEKEIEKQLPSVQPRPEDDWNTSKLPVSKSIKDLGINVVTLPTMLASTVSLKGIKAWPDSAVFATENFYRTVLGHRNLNLDDYLRPVDAVVLFPASGELLLLSEREADLALDAFWNSKPAANSASQNFLVNWVLWRDSFLSKPPGLLPTQSAVRPGLLQDASRLVSIQAFMGDTRYKKEAQKKALQDLVTFVERSCGDARAVKELEAW